MAGGMELLNAGVLKTANLSIILCPYNVCIHVHVHVVSMKHDVGHMFTA